LLLSVAVALLVVQGFSAFLIYRAQMERREVSVIHAAAFRLLSPMPPDYVAHMRPVARFPEVPRSFRVERVAQSPIRPGEPREPQIEKALRGVLIDQDFPVDQLAIVHRSMDGDRFVRQRLDHERRILGSRTPDRPAGRLLLIAAHRSDQKDWFVVRVVEESNQSYIVTSLLWQTVLIYIVMVGVIALVLRRLTRPLAALTARVEQFAETRDPEGRVAPEGPEDVRRLIVAHNDMEARILALLGEKDVMLGAIGHDLKTPLAALRVRIESVEDETERRKMAVTIEDIVRTLDDILSLARVGRPTDPREPSELSALVASIVEEFEDMGQAVTLEDMPRLVVSLRSTWLRRALRNLIGNALRYGVSAHVSLHREPGFAVVRIDDKGPGIAKGDIARMLEPFTRGEPSRNSETGGAGLGLTLAKAIAEQHGGSLLLKNRPEGGLRAELRLPLG
jgi:signal transduction histidine kinase